MCTVYDVAMQIREVYVAGGSMKDVLAALVHGVIVNFMIDGMCKTGLGVVLKPIMATVGLADQMDQVMEAFESGDPDEIVVRLLQLMTMTYGLTRQCFTGDTLVATEEGLREIATIEVGDFVWAEDTETGEKKLQKVLSVHVGETSTLVHVVTEGGTKIDTTECHPFYVEGEGWKAAAELQAGDILRGLDGNGQKIVSVETEVLETPVKVYNLEVDEYHTYFVSVNEVLVHNKYDAADGPSGSKGDIESGKYSHKQNLDGLNEVRKHLTNDVDGFDFEPNKAMMNKIEEMLSGNQDLTGAYKDFYEHELTEGMLMKQGYGYNDAHNMALEIHNVQPQALYAPEIVQEYSKWFNKNDFEYWGIRRK